MRDLTAEWQTFNLKLLPETETQGAELRINLRKLSLSEASHVEHELVLERSVLVLPDFAISREMLVPLTADGFEVIQMDDALGSNWAVAVPQTPAGPTHSSNDQPLPVPDSLGSTVSSEGIQAPEPNNQQIPVEASEGPGVSSEGIQAPESKKQRSEGPGVSSGIQAPEPNKQQLPECSEGPGVSSGIQAPEPNKQQLPECSEGPGVSSGIQAPEPNNQQLPECSVGPGASSEGIQAPEQNNQQLPGVQSSEDPWVSSKGITPATNNQEPPAQGSVGSVGSGVLPQSIAPETNNQQPSDQSDTSSHKPASVVVGRTGSFVLNTNENPANLMSCDDMMAIMGKTNQYSTVVTDIPGLPRGVDPSTNLVWMRVHSSVHQGTPCISQLASLVFSCSDSIRFASIHKHML